MAEEQHTPTSSKNEYTIIRIKRKRSEDVPDILVVDNKGTSKRRDGINAFHFAETIDEAAWKEIEQDELRGRISALSKADKKRTVSQSDENEDEKKEVTVVPGPSKRQRTNNTPRQYRVVTREPEHPSRFYPMPPKVLSSKDVEKGKSKIKIYDVELASTGSKTEVDPEIEKFQSLLQDYLKVQDELPSRGNEDTPPEALRATAGDYVYDIFYHRISTLAERASFTNVATISGLPFDEDDEYESESEIEDEADEDSNAEDYYKNEYPDEESSESNSDGVDLWSEDEWDDTARFQSDY